MADTPGIHLDALHMVEQLPADASWDDVANEVYVRQALAQGIADAESAVWWTTTTASSAPRPASVEQIPDSGTDRLHSVERRAIPAQRLRTRRWPIMKDPSARSQQKSALDGYSHCVRTRE